MNLSQSSDEDSRTYFSIKKLKQLPYHDKDQVSMLGSRSAGLCVYCECGPLLFSLDNADLCLILRN